MPTETPLHPSLQQLLDEADAVMKAYLHLAEQDFMCFARGLTIAGGYGPTVFERVMADFQRNALEDLSPSLMAIRDGDMPERPRHWWERTKKASKDADLAIVLLWVLAFPRRPFYAQVGAGDRGQAAIVKDRMIHLLHHNPWLNDYVEIVSWEVKSKKLTVSGQPMAKLDIMAADIQGAHGGTPDLLVVNELTHVTKWEFVQNLMDNAAGVPQSIILVATNAGYKGSKAEVLRKMAISSDNWTVHVLDKPAPWHNHRSIEDARKQEVSKSRFNRLWYGKWASGKGDALDEAALDACFNHKGCVGPTFDFKAGLAGWECIMGLDIGVHRDHCALAVLGVSFKYKQIRLMHFMSWTPEEEASGEVNLMEVEETCLMMNNQFRCRGMLYDPHQAILMAQRLQVKMYCHPMTFTPSNLMLMANSLVQVVEQGQLQLYDDARGRVRENFGKLNIVEKSYGYRLEATRDETGHADIATAILIALPAAIDMMKGISGLSPDDVLVDGNAEDLSEDELDEMPMELREIHSMDEEDELEAFYKRRPDPLADVL